MDFKGQISMEYLMLFMVFLIIFSTVSIPLLSDTMNDVNDVRKVMETENALIELSKNVKIVHSLGSDSKKSVAIYIPQNMTIRSNYYNNHYYISTGVKLSDNSTKYVNVEVPCDVTFNANINYYYTNVKNRWYYNTEVYWIEKSDRKEINVNFK